MIDGCLRLRPFSTSDLPEVNLASFYLIVCQNIKIQIFEAVKIATYLHGLAGDISAKKLTQTSMIASDIIDAIPKAMKKTK